MTTPQSIVSLVPSLTETVVFFGLLDRLVGRTRYCVEPAGGIEGVETVGGTKNPAVERIIELAPDLVILNREENRLEDCERLQAAGVELYITHPRTVVEAAVMLEELSGVLGVPEQGRRLAESCRRAISAASRRLNDRPRRAAFCPIWRKPLMTFCPSTYIGDVLGLTGLDNVFGEADRGDFFEVSLEEVIARRPEVVVLPDEPYVFRPEHAQELRDAGLDALYFLTSGKDLSWYGPRIPRALETLGAAFPREAG